MDSFELKVFFSADPSVLYNAWLDSETHSKMTGGDAKCSNEVGGAFTAWDEYISGKNISLKQDEEIIQAWRTSEYENTDNDSILTVRFKKVENGSELTLIHTNIPDGQSDYEKGWVEHYFDPMKKYFKEK